MPLDGSRALSMYAGARGAWESVLLTQAKVLLVAFCSGRRGSELPALERPVLVPALHDLSSSHDPRQQ